MSVSADHMTKKMVGIYAQRLIRCGRYLSNFAYAHQAYSHIQLLANDTFTRRTMKLSSLYHHESHQHRGCCSKSPVNVYQ